MLVNGDLKDLGRIMKCSKGVEIIFGYTPEELSGLKIAKLMPNLFATVHERLINNFLKRGSSKFLDKNQYLLIENKCNYL